jgi:hypothetical protein
MRPIILICGRRDADRHASSACRTKASLCQGAWFLAFLVAECGRRIAAPPGRSSSLRCGRSTWTCGFTAGGMAAAGECPAAPEAARWRGRSVAAGPGSGLSEEPVPGVRAGRAGDRVVPLLPSPVPRAGCCRRAPAGSCRGRGTIPAAHALDNAQGHYLPWHGGGSPTAARIRVAIFAALSLSSDLVGPGLPRHRPSCPPRRTGRR